MVKYYGVKEQTEDIDAISRAAEELRLVGCTVLDSGYDADQQSQIADAFERAYATQANTHGGTDALRAIDEHNTIRAPMIYENAFLDLAQNANVLALVAEMLGGSHTTGTFILNQQNGIINPGQQDYNQGLYHRDLPYQHFTSSRPLAVNALYCIEPFTPENGATKVVPGSHKVEAFPSNATVSAMERVVPAPAGSFLVLDCMVYHSGGANVTTNPRRAVNHVYTLPMIRQQLALPRLVPGTDALHENARKLIGCTLPGADSLAEYYASRAERVG